MAGCAGAASASPSGLRGRTTLRSCSPPANPSLVSSAQERPAPSPAPRSDAPGAPQGSARRSAPQLSGDDAVALSNDRADPQHPPPQNAPATCIRSDGSPRTAGISTQTIPRASAPSPQSASALPRHRSPSIPSARSSLPPVDLLPMSPVYSVTYLAGQDQTVALLLGEHAWTLPFAACKLGLGGFECAQALLPLALQAASDQPVVWIDGTVAALGAARFVACSLDAETPLLERGLAICFEPLGSGERGSELCRLEGGDEGPRDGLVDLNAANVEAIDAAALDQDLAGAMIPRCGTAPAIVRVQAASAVPAAGKALQQGAALPHGAAHFVRSGAGVLGDAILVGLIGLPIDESRMMVRDEYLPLGARQLSHALCACTRCIQHRLLAW